MQTQNSTNHDNEIADIAQAVASVLWSSKRTTDKRDAQSLMDFAFELREDGFAYIRRNRDLTREQVNQIRDAQEDARIAWHNARSVVHSA